MVLKKLTRTDKHRQTTRNQADLGIRREKEKKQEKKKGEKSEKNEEGKVKLGRRWIGRAVESNLPPSSTVVNKYLQYLLERRSRK